MQDRNGIEIKKGDTVVTAQRRGSRTWLVTSVVDSIVREAGWFPQGWIDRPVLRSEIDRQTKTGPVPRYYTYGGSSDAILVIKSAETTQLELPI